MVVRQREKQYSKDYINVLTKMMTTVPHALRVRETEFFNLY
jgi:hypothetical protein